MENKTGNHKPSMGLSQFSQKSILYKNVNMYNKLPKNLMLISNPHLLKKWIYCYTMNPKINLKHIDEIDREQPSLHNINSINLNECQSHYETQIMNNVIDDPILNDAPNVPEPILPISNECEPPPPATSPVMATTPPVTPSPVQTSPGLPSQTPTSTECAPPPPSTSPAPGTWSSTSPAPGTWSSTSPRSPIIKVTQDGAEY